MGWDEMFFVSFVWLLLILVAMRGRDTPPAPLERGGLECCFFYLIMSSLVCMFPLWRGDKGVCYGEGGGVG